MTQAGEDQCPSSKTGGEKEGLLPYSAFSFWLNHLDEAHQLGAGGLQSALLRTNSNVSLIQKHSHRPRTKFHQIGHLVAQ